VVPVEFVVNNVFKELCDRDRPCDSRFEARKEKIIRKKCLFVSRQIFEISFTRYSKMVFDRFYLSRNTDSA
jgi:hypothetical protein